MAKKKSTTRRKTQSKSRSTRGGTRKRSSSRKRTSRSKRTKRNLSLNLAQKVLITGITIVFITVLLVLSLLSPAQGQLTLALFDLMMRLFGWGGYVVPLITGAIGLYLVLWGMEQPPELPVYRLGGGGLLYLTFLGFASLTLLMLNNGFTDVWLIAQAQQGGGYLGGLLTYALTTGFGNLGAIFTLTVVGIVGAILLSGVTREEMGNFLQYLFQNRPSLDIFRPSPPQREIPINSGRSQRAVADPAPAQPRLLPDADEAEGEAAPPPRRQPQPAAAKEEPSKRPSSRRKKKQKDEPQSDEAPTVVTPIFLGQNGRPGSYNWTLPEVHRILEPGSDQDPSGTIIREQVEIIEHTLESFGAPATVVEINQGPTITQFGVEPSFLEMRSGKRTKVKVGKIAGLADDLALALAAKSIRIQAPVPGKGYVGIEVPNPAKALVSLRDVMETADFQRIKSPLRIGLGQDVGGQPIVANLAAMPHLLIAGTTGSGKSVCVNAIIAALLLQNTPETLKLVMVDPKRVELTGYNGIPHLAAPVVVGMERVIGVLQWAMREMDNRYKIFADAGARNINDYNSKARRRQSLDLLPYIVIIIDELADLMMLSPEETERGVTRLAQLARATGIHMVIATQRPSVDVVTGLIKANFPARVAFAVASSTDSRVILDATGAERLLGQGDMLYQSPDAAAPVRSQGCFVSDSELQKLISYWKTARRFNMIPAEESVRPKEDAVPPQTKSEPAKETSAPEQSDSASTRPISAPVVNMGHSQAKKEGVAPPPTDDEAPTAVRGKPTGETEEAPPVYNTNGPTQQPLWEALQEMEEEEEPELEDELLPEAIALVRKLNKASTSLLQRRFRIGYTRAARMIDYMEETGIIGPPTGTSKAREVLPPKDKAPEASTEESSSDSSEASES